MTEAQKIAITICEAPEAERNRAIIYLVSEVAGLAAAFQKHGHVEAAFNVEEVLRQSCRMAEGKS